MFNNVHNGRAGLCGPSYRDLISSNLMRARSNFSLKSHIASRMSRNVADVRALSACPNANMLLLRRYFITVGSDTL